MKLFPYLFSLSILISCGDFIDELNTNRKFIDNDATFARSIGQSLTSSKLITTKDLSLVKKFCNSLEAKEYQISTINGAKHYYNLKTQSCTDSELIDQDNFWGEIDSNNGTVLYSSGTAPSDEIFSDILFRSSLMTKELCNKISAGLRNDQFTLADDNTVYFFMTDENPNDVYIQLTVAFARPNQFNPNKKVVYKIGEYTINLVSTSKLGVPGIVTERKEATQCGETDSKSIKVQKFIDSDL